MPLPLPRAKGRRSDPPALCFVPRRWYWSVTGHDPLYKPITVEEFLAIDFPGDRKYELADGVIRMMTGGTPAHARVSTNI